MRDGRRARATSSLKSAMETYGLYRFDGMSRRTSGPGRSRQTRSSPPPTASSGSPYVGRDDAGRRPDCSGLTQYCYRQAGISIPRNTESQYAQGKKLSLSEVQPGDILYRTGHVGIYIGGDRYIPRAPSGRGREDRERDLELHLRPVVSIDKEQEDGQEDETDGHMRRRRCGDPYRGRARALCDSPFRAQIVVPAEEQGQQIEQADDSFSGYAGTTWESEDGTCTLTLSDSTIVESGEAGVQVMYYEVLSEEPDDDGLSAQISFTRSAGEAASQTLLSISDAGGWKSISCDAFALSKSYLIAEGSEAGISSPPTRRSSTSSLDAERRRDRLRHSAEGILGVPRRQRSPPGTARSTSTATRTSSRPPST